MQYIYHIMIRVILMLVFVFSIIFGVKSCIEDKAKAIQDEKQAKIDSLQKVVDSLSSEIFVIETNYQRYQIALDILKQRDTVASQKFEDILYKETE